MSIEPFRVGGLVIFCSEDSNVEVAAAAGEQALVQQPWGKSCHLLDGTIVLSPDLKKVRVTEDRHFGNAEGRTVSSQQDVHVQLCMEEAFNRQTLE